MARNGIERRDVLRALGLAMAAGPFYGITARAFAFGQPNGARDESDRYLLPPGKWVQLFNGKDLTGWKHVGGGGMTVENGMIKAQGGKKDLGLLWWTGGKLCGCVIRVVYKMEHFNDNSGVFIRIPIPPREPWMPVHYGYEVQIDNHPETSGENEYHVTGTLYSLTKPLAFPGKPGPQWNTMEITLHGPRTTVFVNGVKVTDYTEGQPVPPQKFSYEPIRGPRPNCGYIGLQDETGNNVVYFKEVAVKSLKP
ncbi:MAG: 3-keto-disaccharide hydrolase [Terriglobia bacterium]